MPTPNSAVMDFLLTRRSRPAKTLVAPYPTREDLTDILTAAARTPDHGKLEPWRFIVMGKEALARVAGEIATQGPKLGYDAEAIAKQTSTYENAGLAVVVVSAPVDSPKVPQIEQVYSAGAACLALVNAALASGWGANWLSGWPSHDPDICTRGFGLNPGEKIAGIIHLGTERAAPPERPRPDLDQITTWDGV